MRKTVLVTASTLLFINSSFCQTDKKEISSDKKFEFITMPKMGFGKIGESNNVPLNGNITGADFLLGVKIARGLSLQSGAGYFFFNGNRVFNGNSSSLENTYLQIPFKIKTDINLFKNQNDIKNTYLTVGLGVYANNLLKEKSESTLLNNSQSNLGWNLGLSAQVGIKFNLSDLLSLGIAFESQSDVTKVMKDQIEREIESLNTINFSVGYRF